MLTAKLLLRGLLAASLLVQSLAPSFADSYTISVPAGSSFIANQLDNGGNTLSEVLPNVPEETQLLKWDCSAQAFSVGAVYFSDLGGWVDGSTGEPSTVTLAPGEGALIFIQGSGTTLTFTGTPHVPVLPPPQACGCGRTNLLSRQTNGIGTFENITGLAPSEGAQLKRFSGGTYNTYTFSRGAWTPGVPTVNVGEAVSIVTPTVIITSQPPDIAVPECSETNVTFTVIATGNGSLSYQWLFNGAPITDATNASFEIVSVNSTNAGAYVLRISDSCSTVTTAPAQLTVSPTVVITSQPVSVTVTACSNFTFTVAATGKGPLIYQWLFNGQPIPDATNASHEISPLHSSNAGTYTTRISDSCSTVTSALALLTVNPTVVITAHPVSVTVVACSNVTFTVTATGNGPLIYQWWFNEQPIPGATNVSYEITSVSQTNAGNFSVRIMDSCSSLTSVPVRLTAEPSLILTTQPADTTVMEGISATFGVVAASGCGPIAYQWLRNGKLVPGATNANYSTATSEPCDNGDRYQVQVSDSEATIFSRMARLTVTSIQVCTNELRTVLILSTTVAEGANSLEAQAAASLGYDVEIATPDDWTAKSAAEFARYRAIILGDPGCRLSTSIAAAVANNSVWAPVIDGNVILIGTDPIVHQSQGGRGLVDHGVRFAVDQVNKTGLYVALSCYYHDMASYQPVPVLEHLSEFGSFTVTGVGCYNDAHIVATHPALNSPPALADSDLSNWSCSVHEAFDSWPADFLVLAIARGIGASFTAADGSVGTPYILARGQGLTVVSDIALAPDNATNVVNTAHTVVATVRTNGTPAANVTVTFRVVTGPNAGRTGSGFTDAAGQATFTYTGGASTGTDFIEAQFVDGRGRTQTSNRAKKVWIECPVSLVCPPDILATNQPGQCSAQAQVGQPSATDACSGVPLSRGARSDGRGLDEPYPVGTTIIAWTATNASGGSTVCTQTVAVLDGELPAITCPADLVMCVDPGQTSKSNVSYAVTATDNCSGVNFSCNPPSGSPFPVGTTPVSCVATDAAGNTNQCVFTVTVNANTAAAPLSNLTRCRGDSATYTAVTSGGGALSYGWTLDGSPIGTDSPLLVVATGGLTDGNHTVQYIVTGECGLVTNRGTLTVQSCARGGPCSFTQGFYGNPNGKFNGTRSITLISNLLSTAPLVVGTTGVRSLTIPQSAVPLLQARMPAGGTPANLPDSGDQNLLTAVLPLSKGKFLNILLGQTITLSLNVRLDLSLPAVQLRANFCTQGVSAGPDASLGTADDVPVTGDVRMFAIPNSVLVALSTPGLGINDVTVHGLLELANRALAGLPTGPASLPDVNSAVDAINRGFDACRVLVDCITLAPLAFSSDDRFGNPIILDNSGDKSGWGFVAAGKAVAANSSVTAQVFRTEGFNCEASKTPGEPDVAGNGGGKPLWWQWQATVSGLVTIQTAGSSFDTLLGVYVGPSHSNLTLVASSDDTFGSVMAQVTFQAITGTNYLIAVDGFDGACGSIVLQIITGGPRLGQVKVLPGGGRRFGIEGELGRIYVVEGSSDLVIWESVAAVENSAAILQFVDRHAQTSSQRFYRVVIEP